MKKVKLQKITREAVEALVRYFANAQKWADCNDDDPEHRLSRIMTGSLLQVIRLRLFNKLATNMQLRHFQVTLEKHEVAAFLLYYESEALNSHRLDKALILDFAGKLDKAIS